MLNLCIQNPYSFASVIRRDGVGHLIARRRGIVVAVATLVVGLPLLVALADLRSQRWHPVLDLAMTELRVRDVGGEQTPLIGLPGRIAPGPEQGSHPGPLSFYLLAPVYRLLGSTSWALEAATVAVHLAAVATALWIAHRRAGWRGVLAAGALLAVVMRGYGQVLLTQPWNPYLPLLLWIVVLLAAWAVACGDRWMLVPMVIAGSFCAQTHVPYLVPAGALTIGAIVVAVRRQPRHHPGITSSMAQRRLDRAVVVTVELGLLLWLPPVIDQAINDPGNVRKLVDHFGSPPDEPLGVADGIRLALKHLDVWAGFVGQFADTGRFVSPSSTWRGAVVLVVWLIAVGGAWRFGSPSLRALHTVVGAALLLGLVSMTRIFGLPWFYLTLWAWGTAAVALGAIVWTVAAAWQSFDGAEHRRAWRPPGRRSPAAVAIPALSAVVLVFGVAMSTVSFADAEIPEERLSIAVGALAEPTYQAIVDGVGASSGSEAIYQVRWSDAADIGSPGFGLLDELERRGLDVRADPYFHIPATAYRVGERTAADAQIHLATGSYIDAWRQVPDAVEVATYEPRDAGEVADYHRTRRRLLERLAGEDLDDVIALVDTNLFGGSLDPRLSAADVDDFTVLLELGQPMSVFIAPATADPAP